MNWEGRAGSFTAALAVPAARTDLQVLAALADAMDVHLGLPDNASRDPRTAAAHDRNDGRSVRGRFRPASSPRASAAGGRGAGLPGAAAAESPAGPGVTLLATWHNLLDAGRMQDGEPNLAGTARAAVARMSRRDRGRGRDG